MSPPVAAAIIKSIELIENAVEPRENLYRKARALRCLIHGAGYPAMETFSPIIPLHTGEDEVTYRLTKFLREQGILVSPVVYPAVQRGKSRIRLCINVDHTGEDFENFVSWLHRFDKILWLGKKYPVTVHHYERIAEVPEDTWNFTCNDIDPFHQYDFLRTVEEAHVENSTIRYLLFHKDEAVIGSAVLSLFPVDLAIFLGSNFLVK